MLFKLNSLKIFPNLNTMPLTFLVHKSLKFWSMYSSISSPPPTNGPPKSLTCCPSAAMCSQLLSPGNDWLFSASITLAFLEKQMHHTAYGLLNVASLIEHNALEIPSCSCVYWLFVLSYCWLLLPLYGWTTIPCSFISDYFLNTLLFHIIALESNEAPVT